VRRVPTFVTRAARAVLRIRAVSGDQWALRALLAAAAMIRNNPVPAEK